MKRLFTLYFIILIVGALSEEKETQPLKDKTEIDNLKEEDQDLSNKLSTIRRHSPRNTLLHNLAKG